MLVVFGLASLRAFLWLIHPAGDEWRVLSPNNLGDLSLHLNLIRYLASGVAFWPQSSILAGVPLTYPLGADIFNSLLTLTGVPVERGLIWTGLAGAALTGWALWRWGGAFGLAALLFNGGLAGWMIFAGAGLRDFQAELAWKNLFLSMFITQRGLLFALPAGLVMMSCWRRVCEGKTPDIPHGVQLLLYAAMPLFNVHAFLFLSLLLACLFALAPARRAYFFGLVAAALVPATCAVLLVTGVFASNSGLRFLPGWMQADAGWKFWVINFGVALPLLILLPFRTFRDGVARAFVLAGLVTFVVCFLFAFAVWEWDNTKLLLWSWLACVPWIWSALIRPCPVPIRAALCVTLFFSGAISLLAGLDGRHGYKLASRSELAKTAALLREVSPTDRIAVRPDYNHPVFLLGRPVLCGYEGHLWSHGLDYRPQWERLKAVLALPSDWRQQAKGLNANWLYLEGPMPILMPLHQEKSEPHDSIFP
jgi:hypothetical protein